MDELGCTAIAPRWQWAWKSDYRGRIHTRAEALRTSFFALASSVCRWGADTSCAECHWRYVCGGLDGASLLGDGAATSNEHDV